MSKGKDNKPKKSRGASSSRGHDGRTYNHILSHGVHSRQAFLNSHHGDYFVAFVETFRNLTEQDVLLREDYALDLVGRYLNVPREMVHLTHRRGQTTQSLINLDELRYIKLGKSFVGRVGIRTTRIGKRIMLTYVFSQKQEQLRQITHTRPGRVGNPYRKRNKSEINDTNRKSHNRRGQSRKGK